MPNNKNAKQTTETATPVAPSKTVAQKGGKKEAVVAATPVAAGPVAAPVAAAPVAAAPVAAAQKGGKKAAAVSKETVSKETTPTSSTPVVATVSKESTPAQKGGKKAAAKATTEPAAAAPAPTQKGGKKAAAKATTEAAAATPAQKGGKKAAAKVAAPKKEKAAPKTTEATEGEDAEETADGRRIRSFKVRLPNKEDFEGRFTGLTPYQAANKALSKYFRETEAPQVEVTFSICESTRKSKKSVYTYVGKRLKLEVPVTYKIQDGREIVKNFKNSLKKVKKSETEASA